MDYALSMGLAKLFAERLLNVPWLIHLDRYWPSACQRLDPDRDTRPDLVGIDAVENSGFAVEVKGRAGDSVTPSVLCKAKEQTENLTEFVGNPVRYRVAFGAFFPRDRGVGVKWRDPEVPSPPEPNKEAVIRFVTDYYAPVLELLKDPAVVDVSNNAYRAVYIYEADLFLGLSHSIADSANAADRYDAALRFARDGGDPSLDESEGRGSPAVSRGRDGILVGLGKSWFAIEELSRRP